MLYHYHIYILTFRWSFISIFKWLSKSFWLLNLSSHPNDLNAQVSSSKLLFSDFDLYRQLASWESISNEGKTAVHPKAVNEQGDLIWEISLLVKLSGKMSVSEFNGCWSIGHFPSRL